MTPVTWKRVAMALPIGVALVAAGSGCGDGDSSDAADSGPAVKVTVSREFSRVPMASKLVPLEGHRTALRALRETAEVATGSGGAWVKSIDGHASALEGARETTWAMNVNGIEADASANELRLYAGDVLQLDLRDWYVTLDVRATVGAFPETFSRGDGGRRFPVTVECQQPGSSACRQVRSALRRAGVDPDGARPPGRRPELGRPRRAKILVGEWSHWADRPWPRRIDKGARYSGVFARFSPAGDELRLLDWDAHRTRTLGAGAGLVGALRPSEEDLLWVVTGTDAEGVDLAAAALTRGKLRDAFAAAVTRDGVVRLPLPPPGG